MDYQIGEDGWLEVVGEQTRGGSTYGVNTLAPWLGGDQRAFQVLGDLMQKSPAFNQYVNARAAASRPMTTSIPLQKARDWQVDFGPVSGASSTTTTITVQPQCLFRGEKVMATDTGGAGTAVGYATSIGTILIGNRLQRPAGTGYTLTAFFANNSLGNGIRWDTCEKALSISVTVSFITASTFYMTVFGKAVL